jgi:hypothetical protein
MEKAAGIPAPPVDVDTDVRQRLIELYARRPLGLGLVVRMTDTGEWPTRMAHLEGALDEYEQALAARAAGDTRLPADGARAQALVGDPDGAALYASVRDSAPTRLVLQRAPRLSTADPMLVGALARFADLKPGLDGNLVSRDRVFTRIFKKAVKQPVLVDELLREDFARLAALPHAMFTELAAVATHPEWSDQIERVERLLEAGAPEPIDALLPEAKKLLELARPPRRANEAVPAGHMPAANAAEQSRPVSVLLQGTVRFSAMLREEVLAFATVKELLPEAETLVKTKTKLSEHERQQTHGQKAIGLLLQHNPDTVGHIRQWLEVRIKAAQHYVELRSFLKLEALRLSWPELTGYLSDRTALLELESLAQSGKADDAVLGRLSRYREDPRLMRFLRLRPWLKDMSSSQLQAYLATSPAVDGPSAVAAASAATSSAVSANEASPPEEATFTIRRSEFAIEVALHLGGQRHAAMIPADRIGAMSSVSFEQWQDVQRASLLGRELFDWAFPPALRTPLLDALKTHSRFRLWIQPSNEAVVPASGAPPAAPADATDATLFNLPWEALYVSELNGFLAAQGCSIVRWYAARRPTPPLRFDRPLRMLAVFSNPSATAPINVAAEMEVLRQVCAAAQEANLIQLTVLGPELATRESIWQAISAIQPQVFHFTGHGVYDADKHEGALVVGELNDQLDLMFASQVGALLSNNGVLLALLNSCDTGSSGSNAAVTGVAGTLVGQGIPAVVATLRQVTDENAIMFTKSYYSSLVEGESVEAAMYRTRTALSMERQDWSVYALYASTHDIGRLVADVPRRRVTAALPQTANTAVTR